MRLRHFLCFYFGKMLKILEKLPFFRADMAGLGSIGLYHVPMNTDHSTNGQPGEDVGQPGIPGCPTQPGIPGCPTQPGIPGCPTQARRFSVGHPGIISEYSWLSHN